LVPNMVNLESVEADWDLSANNRLSGIGGGGAGISGLGLGLGGISPGLGLGGISPGLGLGGISPGLGLGLSPASPILDVTSRHIADSFGRYVANRIPTFLDRVFIRGMDDDDYYDDD